MPRCEHIFYCPTPGACRQKMQASDINFMANVARDQEKRRGQAEKESAAARRSELREQRQEQFGSGLFPQEKLTRYAIIAVAGVVAFAIVFAVLVRVLGFVITYLIPVAIVLGAAYLIRRGYRAQMAKKASTPAGSPGIEPGWYRDPYGAAEPRYFNGVEWLAHPPE